MAFSALPLALMLANEFRDQIGIKKAVAQAIEDCVLEAVAAHGLAGVAGATVANIGAAILVCVDEDEAAATDNTLEDY
ncbi:hypothetical protein [Georhizobium sp. MAB10]|uniref:hypothetical protein n=1 Tax=Georhizobium sp. MAB10 TaxID=3028319 RepID=UPI003855B94D